MELKQLLRRYRTFMTAPISPLPLALFRCCFAALILVNAAMLLPDLKLWFSEQGILPASLLKMRSGDGNFSLFWFFGFSDRALIGIYVLHGLAALCLLLGWKTRCAAFWVFVTLTSLHHRNTFILSSADTLMRLMSFFLMFGDSGAALSLDRLLRLRKGLAQPGVLAPIHPLPLRLMQWQLCLVYFSAFCWKIMGPQWVNGHAVFIVQQLTQFTRFPVPEFMRSVEVSRALTYFTLWVEGTFPFLILFSDTRRFALLSALLLHLGLEYTMNIQMFQWMMLTSLLCFVREEEIFILQNWLRRIYNEKISSRFRFVRPSFVLRRKRI